MMKIFPSLGVLIFSTVSGTSETRDPCAALCFRDGLGICTSGSTLNKEGLCSNYYFRSVKKTDHCYTLTSVPDCPMTFPMSGNAAFRRIQVLLYNQRMEMNVADPTIDEETFEYAINGFNFIDISSPRLRRTSSEEPDVSGSVLIARVVGDDRDFPEGAK